MKNSDLRTAILALLAAALLLGSFGAIALQQENRPAATPPPVKTRPRAVVAPPDYAAESPVSLSDPDGQQLVLEQMSVRAAVQGMLSLTEMELRFRNPQARRIEGRFTCVLPRGASISRFAKEVNGQLMEGEVVERLRANQVYEQFLHQMRDPALLEQDQGNRFSARIFPIDPNGSVRLILSYSRLLPLENGVRTYEFPLRGMPKIGAFSFRGVFSPLKGEQAVTSNASALEGPKSASRSAAEVMTIDENNYSPREDIEVRWRPQNGAPATRLLKAGDFYLVSFHVAPPATMTRQRLPWIFAIDTSASAADGAAHRITALEELFGRLPSDDQVEILAFDQSVVPLMKGTAAEAASQIRTLLETRHFLGGTDLRLALAELQKRATSNQRIVLVSDGVATLGQTEAADVASQAKAFGARPVYALVLGSREDAPSLQSIVSGRGRIVRIPFTQSMTSKAAEAAELLQQPLGATFEVSDPAAEWLYPARFEDVYRDTELIALAKVRPASNAAPQARGSGMALTAASAEALPIGTFEPLLEREAYRAYVEYLAQREASEPSAPIRSALATEQVKVSVEHRVVIPRTTMLVLESEWDYQRFNLDRRALAAILTVGAAGIERIDRTNPNALPPPPLPRPVTKAAPRPVTNDRAVAGGVEGGVEGGVVGGVVGGVAAPPAQRSAAVAEAITVSAEADDVNGITPQEAAAVPALDEPAERQESRMIAAPRPASPSQRVAPAIVPEQVQVTPKPQRPDWIVPSGRSSEDLAALLAQLKANPRDRELYNQASEELFRRGEWKRLNAIAYDWQPLDPDNPQVYEMIGESALAMNRDEEAARAFGSLVEVAPGKTELLQRAALLLMRTNRAELGEAALRKALAVRPDRANGYRSLALLLWQQHRFEEAARVLEEATRQNFPAWYGNVQRVVREELAYVYRDWIAADPARRQEIASRAQTYGADLDRFDALRVTLVWETDANDVDLHVVDPNGEEAFYSHRNTASGLELYEDITQGLGPEVIRTSRVKKGTYYVGVKYFNAGPMGVSRGLAVITRPAKSGTSVQVVPFRLIEGGGDVRLIAKVEM